MLKYFHELTRGEFSELCKNKMTWDECTKEYPQPKWCKYPNAVCGSMGCWLLMDFGVGSPDSCKHCEFNKEAQDAKH